MSKLFYKIPLEEEFNPNLLPDDTPGIENMTYKTVTENIPHFKELKAWLEADFNNEAAAGVIKGFDGVLENKVATCSLRCHNGKDGKAYAMITTEFVPGFRLSEKRRNEFWDQMHGQMVDGWGECVDGHQIPGAPAGWALYL